MKKLMIMLIAVFTMLGLASCDMAYKIETVDENGNPMTYEVTQTEDKAKVAETIVLLSSQKTEEVAESVKIGFDINMLGKTDDDNYIEFDADGTFKYNIETKSMYAKLDMNYEMSSKTALTGLTTSYMDLKTKAYTDNEYIYLDGKFDANDEETKLKNKIDVSSASGMLEEFIPFDLDSLESSLSGNLINKEQILKLVEQYNIIITNTTTRYVTFQLNYLQSGSKTPIIISLKIDAKKMLPKKIEIDAEDYLKEVYNGDDAKSKFKFEMNFSYGNFAVDVLTVKEKAEYEDISKLLGLGNLF